MSIELKLTPEVEALLSRFSPEERELLMKDLAKPARTKKEKVAKELSPELLAAQQAFDEFVKQHQDIIDAYEGLKTELTKHKSKTHVRIATKAYSFKPESGDPGIYNESNQSIAIFGEKGWQGAMTAAGYTGGQIQAVYKAASIAKKKASEAALAAA